MSSQEPAEHGNPKNAYWSEYVKTGLVTVGVLILVALIAIMVGLIDVPIGA